jgi:threonylcarbamoyladenosine tRNA methylthiotransferase MtaB
LKYSVITFGCRVNQADSLGFEEDLLLHGAVPVAPEQADVVIVNTCSVTATADQGARQTIRRVARENPAARIVVTGCYATRKPDDVRDLPNVVRVVSNDDKPRLLSLVRADDHGPTTAVRFGAGGGSCGAAVAPGVAGRTAFTLRVQTGCAEACSYCIIPSTRGRPRSLSVDAVLAEIARVVAAGFKDIVLTGVHLGSYGRDLVPPWSLVELLRAVRLKADATHDDGSVRLQPDVLFRISSLEPMDCSREIVELVANSSCFAPHFHLPLQHASNPILAAMRRPYTIEYYAALVDEIRTRIPHASIGSDVIVGFPGETDPDFEQLATYLERSPLTHVHVFPYSDRPGTDATTMSGKVDGAVIRERGRRVREIAQRLSYRFRESQVGTVRPGLTIEDGSTVVTDNYLKLRIPVGLSRNAHVNVRVRSLHEADLAQDQLSVGVLRT